MLRRALAAFVLAFVLLLGARARAFAVPELTGRVVDQAHKLTDAERATIDAKLAAFDQDTTDQIVVFITPSLGGQTIEDVSYEVAKRWKIGQAGKDNGVLLTIAPRERQIRIETGKGVGDRLTDLQSNDIIMKRIGPELRRERFFEGVNAGVDDIIGALHPGWTYQGRTFRAPPAPEPIAVPVAAFFFFFIVFVLFVLSVARRLRGNSGWTTAAGVWSASDSSWSSGGGGGGSGFSGGGGDFGGGGSSGSY